MTSWKGVILLALVATSIPFLYVASIPAPVASPVVSLSPVDYARAITPFIEAFDADGQHLWEASGVWIDPIHVLTAKHVVTSSDSIDGNSYPDPAYWEITDSQGVVHRAHSVAKDWAHDVAMLTIEGTYSGPVAEVSRDVLKVGDDVVMCGWALGLGLETTWGRIANLEGRSWAEGDVICAVTCAPGCSGGPVLHDGKLVGIVSRGQEGFLVIEPVITFGVK